MTSFDESCARQASLLAVQYDTHAVAEQSNLATRPRIDGMEWNGFTIIILETRMWWNQLAPTCLVIWWTPHPRTRIPSSHINVHADVAALWTWHTSIWPETCNFFYTHRTRKCISQDRATFIYCLYPDSSVTSHAVESWQPTITSWWIDGCHWLRREDAGSCPSCCGEIFSSNTAEWCCQLTL